MLQLKSVGGARVVGFTRRDAERQSESSPGCLLSPPIVRGRAAGHLRGGDRVAGAASEAAYLAAAPPKSSFEGALRPVKRAFKGQAQRE
jgi:hypothetical protein